jgi:hypothetical protein
MTDETKDILFKVWDFCDDKDKSIEYMLQYMADAAEIGYMEAVNFVVTQGDQRNKWRSEIKGNKKMYICPYSDLERWKESFKKSKLYHKPFSLASRNKGGRRGRPPRLWKND